MMKIKSIASSSSGNCTYIFNDQNGFLIDSGGKGVSMKRILEAVGGGPLNAIFITHEHGDHMGTAGPIGRKRNIPIYMHKDSYKRFEHDEWFEKFAYEKDSDLYGRKPKFKDCEIRYIDPLETYELGNFRIKPFSTPHDAAYSMGFVITDITTNKKLGYLTDCGSFTKIMQLALQGCDAYLIEADYDEQMLEEFEDYDELLKQRIRSNLGHLSNEQTMGFLEKIGIDQSEFVMFCHLSTRTNSPEKVLELANSRFPEFKKFYIAPSDDVFEL